MVENGKDIVEKTKELKAANSIETAKTIFEEIENFRNTQT